MHVGGVCNLLLEEASQETRIGVKHGSQAGFKHRSGFRSPFSRIIIRLVVSASCSLDNKLLQLSEFITNSCSLS